MPSPNSENHLDENVHQQLVPKQFVCSRPKNKSISKIHQNAQQAILRDISCVPAYNGRSTSTDNAKRFFVRSMSLLDRQRPPNLHPSFHTGNTETNKAQPQIQATGSLIFFVQKRISVYLHDFFRSPIFVSWRRSYNLVIVIVSENMSKNGFQRKMLCAPKCWFSVWLLHTSTSSKSRDKTRRCWKQRTSGHRDAAWNTATAICHLPMWCSS